MIVYTGFENNRPSKLYLHKIGDSKNKNLLLLSEKDVEYDIELSQTTSKNYVIVDVTSKNQNEIWLVNKENANISLVYKRKEKEQVTIDHFTGDSFYTALISAGNYKIVKTYIEDLNTDILLSSKRKAKQLLNLLL